MHDLDDLIGGKVFATMAGVSPAAVVNWLKTESYDGPRPICNPEGSPGPLFSRVQCAEWIVARANDKAAAKQAQIAALKAKLAELEGDAA